MCGGLYTTPVSADPLEVSVYEGAVPAGGVSDRKSKWTQFKEPEIPCQKVVGDGFSQVTRFWVLCVEQLVVTVSKKETSGQISVCADKNSTFRTRSWDVSGHDCAVF